MVTLLAYTKDLADADATFSYQESLLALQVEPTAREVKPQLLVEEVPFVHTARRLEVEALRTVARAATGDRISDEEDLFDLVPDNESHHFHLDSSFTSAYEQELRAILESPLSSLAPSPVASPLPGPSTRPRSNSDPQQTHRICLIQIYFEPGQTSKKIQVRHRHQHFSLCTRPFVGQEQTDSFSFQHGRSTTSTSAEPAVTYQRIWGKCLAGAGKDLKTR